MGSHWKLHTHRKDLAYSRSVARCSLYSPANDSIRLHIPRTLRLIYDIRNKRNAAHLADGIDPNVQDATLVIRNMEWALAELVRLYHHVPADEAQQIIAELVSRKSLSSNSSMAFRGSFETLRHLTTVSFCCIGAALKESLSLSCPHGCALA